MKMVPSIIYKPTYLSTPKKNKQVTIVMPSPNHKQSRKRVSWSNHEVYINDSNNNDTMTNMKKKARRTAPSRPPRDIGLFPKGTEWKYDHNDVSYCSKGE